MAGADTDLVKILGVIATALTTGVTILLTSYMRVRKQLTDMKGEESRVNRDITQDKTDEKSLQMLLRSAEQWEAQYNKSVARETRYRRLLAVSEAKMRRQILQASEDRSQDRLKIEALVALLAEKDRKIVLLEAEIGGRRRTDLT
jgi:septal ring factor EnvC (AmiA/AmiB activator)